MEIIRATNAHIAAVMGILDSAREYQRQSGFRQWDDGYPSEAVVAADIASGHAYVFTRQGEVAGYAFLPEGDAAYDTFESVWRLTGRYGAVHRLAVAPQARGIGASAPMFTLIEETFRQRGIGIVRIDTGLENAVMRHLLEKYGYTPLGAYEFPWGARLAYEKMLPSAGTPRSAKQIPAAER